MPGMEYFKNSEFYYAVTFHEMIHWTGHESRLNRFLSATVARFGSETYAQEELVAEIGSAFLCGITAIDNERLNDNRDAYIKNWLRALKDDPKLVVKAAGQAQKAADFILGREHDYDAPEKKKKPGNDDIPF